MDDRPPTPVQSQDHQSESAPDQLQPPKPEDFRGYVSDLDMTEEEVITTLTSLFECMRILIEIDLGLSPVQKLLESFSSAAEKDADMVILPNTNRKKDQ